MKYFDWFHQNENIYQFSDDLRLEWRSSLHWAWSLRVTWQSAIASGIVPRASGQRTWSRPEIIWIYTEEIFSDNKPGHSSADFIHLSGVLLVIKYLLVSASWSVLHIGQWSDPGPNIHLHLLIVNLNVATPRPVVDVLGAPHLAVHVPVQPPVLDPHLTSAWLVISLLQRSNLGPDIPAQLPLLYLLVPASRSVAGVDVDCSGAHVPVQLPVLNLDLSSSRLVVGVGQWTNLGGGFAKVRRRRETHHNLVHGNWNIFEYSCWEKIFSHLSCLVPGWRVLMRMMRMLDEREEQVVELRRGHSDSESSWCWPPSGCEICLEATEEQLWLELSSSRESWQSQWLIAPVFNINIDRNISQCNSDDVIFCCFLHIYKEIQLLFREEVRVALTCWQVCRVVWVEKSSPASPHHCHCLQQQQY